MFKVCWDKEINGVLLCQSCDEPLNISPRPVFREELDILGFDRYWKYPQDSKSPLLWALGRRYFYKGIWVAEAKGGNLFEAPEIIITEDGKNLTLQPIDTRKLIEKNKEALFILENEAIDFVLDTYTKYKNRVDFIAVAFSGGKDSQVVLDIVSRVLPPDEFIVVFSDTTMELPHTYEIVEHTKKEYQKKYPTLKFYTVKPPKSAIEFWEDFGPPSRIHRWCCTVIKTAPFVNFIRELYHEKGNTKNPKILVFEGVRTEESEARSGYTRIALGVKHLTVINSRPILNWNTTELFCFLSKINTELNCLYRFGLTRAGCIVCPFGSTWSDYLINRIYPEVLEPYYTIIEKTLIENRLTSKSEKIKYLKNGKWKERAGGNVFVPNNRLIFVSNKRYLKIILNKNTQDFSELIKVISDRIYVRERNGIILGEINDPKCTFTFRIISKSQKTIILLHFILITETYYSKIKKVLYKTAYCRSCGACVVECKEGALTFLNGKLTIGKTCVHCFNCIDFCEKGCLVAKSIHVKQEQQ